MVTLTALDGVGLVRLVETYRDVLASHREVLNRLNVYPVPDGDTGTNMTLTLASVCDELAALPDPGPGSPELGAPPLQTVAAAIAHGSLMGARGNSGVILSQ